jgi:hypothetical protein
VSQPRSKLCPIRYDQRSYWVHWDTNTASLATTSGRQKLNFIVPHYATHYTGYPVDSADLLYRKGSFWLHVVVTIPDPDVTSNGEAVGVDLGLTQPSGGNEQPAVSRQKALERSRAPVFPHPTCVTVPVAQNRLASIFGSLADESYGFGATVTTFCPNALLVVSLIPALPSCLRT